MSTVQLEELSIGDLTSALRRRRSTVFAVALACVLLAGLYCLLATHRYSASGAIEIGKRKVDAAGLDSLTKTDSESSDALEGNIDVQTQANILQSDAFAVAAIQQLHLEGTHDYLSSSADGEVSGASLEDSPRRLQPLVKKFHRHLKVNPVGGTRIIQIEFLNPDPKLATTVVNFLIDQIRSQGFRTRNLATAETSEWLTRQLAELRQQSEDAEAKVAALQRQTGVYTLGTDAQGHEQSYSGTLDSLEKATTALNLAAQNRIVKHAIADMVEHGDPEALSSIAGNVNGPPLESMAVIQNLRQQQAAQSAALGQAEAKFGKAWPKVLEMQANLRELDKAISAEYGRIRSRAKSDYQIALQTETGQRDAYEMAKRDATRLNDKAVAYAVARQEADQSRQLYEDVLRRFKEASLLEGWHSSNIVVIDRGRASDKPKSPDTPVYLAFALLGGLALGGCSAIAADLVDGRLKTVKQIEKSFGAKIYGVLPLSLERGGRGDLFRSEGQPVTAYDEGVRRICLRLLAQRGGAPSTVILVCGPIHGQGKTTLSASMASALALAGRRVLLVDADLRDRKLSLRAMSAPDRSGMNEVFTGFGPVTPELSMAGIHGLDMLGAGSSANESTGLLVRPNVKAWIAAQQREYEFLIFDTSALLTQADALALYPYADQVLCVARIGQVTVSQFEYSLNLIKQFGDFEKVGVVVNGLSPLDEDYAACFGRPQQRALKGGSHAFLS